MGPPTSRTAGHPKSIVSQPPHGLKVTPQRCPSSARALAGGPWRAHRKGGDAGACLSVIEHRPVVHMQERRAARNKRSASLGGPAMRGQASATAIGRARDMFNTLRTPTPPRRRATPKTLRHLGGPTSQSRPTTRVGADDGLSRCALVCVLCVTPPPYSHSLTGSPLPLPVSEHRTPHFS